MITVTEALDIISTNTIDFGTVTVPLDTVVGRVLEENLFADRDFPPFDRVAMDGIALQYSAFKAGQRNFSIQGIVPAGNSQTRLKDPTACLEVMTGSVLPEGADTVIRYEDITIESGNAHINVENIRFQQNIHFRGKDRKKGELIVPKKTILSAAEIGVCATIGKKEIQVAALPKVMIISSGNELVEIEQTPLPHQIRQSNVHTIKAILQNRLIPAEIDHLDDQPEAITEKVKTYIENYNMIIISGGVSKGKFDYFPDILKNLGVSKKFHIVKQRPGKPFWFGVYGTKCAIFALPGNPVSSFLCTQYYVNFWLDQCLNTPRAYLPHASLTEQVSFKPDLTYFLPVITEYSDQGQLLATPAKGNGSGDLANLVDADAFIQLPRGKDLFHEGEAYPIFLYR